MPYLLFVLNDIYRVDAVELANALIKEKQWIYSSSPPNKALLKPGTKVILYIAGSGRQKFYCRFEIDSNLADCDISVLIMDLVPDSNQIKFRNHFPLSTKLNNIEVWENAPSIKALINELEFIENKKYYGASLRRAAIRIEEADYNKIVSCATKGL